MSESPIIKLGRAGIIILSLIYISNRHLLKMASAQSFVDAEIRDNKVVVFSKTYCPYCKMAKSALDGAGLKNYKVIELENHSMCAQIQDYLLDLTGARSVPRVFIGGKCIGGGSETKALQDQGKLATMLKENGAM